jgi:hypothetical protein
MVDRLTPLVPSEVEGRVARSEQSPLDFARDERACRGGADA